MSRLRNIGDALPPRLRGYVLAIIAFGVPVVAAAIVGVVDGRPTPRMLLGISTFFCLTMLAEWRPVPIDVEGSRLVSLAFVFIIASQLIFGWEWSVLIGSSAIGLAMRIDHVEPIKVVFNSAVYAIAAVTAAAPLAIEGTGNHGYGMLALIVVVSGAIFVLVNVLLVCGAIGLASETPVHEVFSDHLRHSGPIFVMSVFVAAQAVILWQLSAPLVLLLSAPLFALTLYQRSSVRGRVAEEAASTDSLTSLKNRRAFEEEAAQLMAVAQDGIGALSLCLIDIDRFKQVNDRHGHLTGDAILQILGRAIEAAVPGGGYRLGGDEFVLLFPSEEHLQVISAVQERFVEAQSQLPTLGETVTISAGIAVYPEHADDLRSLQKRADMALYRSKYNGRARVSVYVDDEPHGQSLAQGIDRLPDGRLLTAHRLVSLVDALANASAQKQDVLTPLEFGDVLDGWRSVDSHHSQAVASLALALARRLGLSGEEFDQVQIAALLHDVGKIGLPDRVLSKPGPLSDDERALIERHPIIGHELLRDLGHATAATLVLHHHERWDGCGYPRGLAGAEIPFGSRLILVADAFDALTSDRSYRKGVSIDAAIREIQSEAGRQFDPLVVSVLHEHFAHPESSNHDLTLEQEAAWSSSTLSS